MLPRVNIRSADGTIGIVKGQINRVRWQTWAAAAFFLIAFCGLGLVAVKFAPMFQPLGGAYQPLSHKFIFACGPIAFPLFGIVAAAALISSDIRFHDRWKQWTLVAMFALLMIWVVSWFITPVM